MPPGALIGVGSRGQPVAAQIAHWITTDPPTLLALDAPLGWPAEFGPALARHQAGAPLVPQPAQLFHSSTDQVVPQTTGKRPLEVGADRIARTAYAALALLQELREITGEPIPLSWSAELNRLSAIEVYPAATLASRNLPTSGYKRRDQREQREAILDAIGASIGLPTNPTALIENADALDAALCVLAGWDFLCGAARPPSDPGLARKDQAWLSWTTTASLGARGANPSQASSSWMTWTP